MPRTFCKDCRKDLKVMNYRDRSDNKDRNISVEPIYYCANENKIVARIGDNQMDLWDVEKDTILIDPDFATNDLYFEFMEEHRDNTDRDDPDRIPDNPI